MWLWLRLRLWLNPLSEGKNFLTLLLAEVLSYIVYFGLVFILWKKMKSIKESANIQSTV